CPFRPLRSFGPLESPEAASEQLFKSATFSLYIRPTDAKIDRRNPAVARTRGVRSPRRRVASMRALLTIEAGLGEPRVCTLVPERRVTLGRHRNNLVVLQDEHASRWHAEVFLENGRWFIRDFGALNGTRVNGQAIAQQVALEHGQLINIGKTALRFTVENG